MVVIREIPSFAWPLPLVHSLRKEISFSSGAACELSIFAINPSTASFKNNMLSLANWEGELISCAIPEAN